MIQEPLKAVLSKIRCIVLDVDGVLTDGSIYFGENGECTKVFNTKDGYILMHMMAMGYHVALISGGRSPIIMQRAKALNIPYVFTEIKEKLPVFNQLIKELSLTPSEVAYMGDEYIDIPVLKAVGCAACPNDAIPQVKAICNFIADHNGGRGAVRELCDAILEAQNKCVI